MSIDPTDERPNNSKEAINEEVAVAPSPGAEEDNGTESGDAGCEACEPPKVVPAGVEGLGAGDLAACNCDDDDAEDDLDGTREEFDEIADHATGSVVQVDLGAGHCGGCVCVLSVRAVVMICG